MPKYFPKQLDAFEKLLAYAKGKNIAVLGHIRPDGDCISSTFALADILKDAGANKTECLNEHELPYMYENFAYGRKIIPVKSFDATGFEIVTVDCADYARTGPTAPEKFPAPLGTIDHHVSNKPIAKICVLDATASATAELIAGLCLDAGIKISKENANRLYMGMAMDTRQFTTSSTNAKTFNIATELVELGADAAWVAVQLYQRERFSKMKLLASFLQTLTMHFGGRVCIGMLSEGIFEKLGAQKAESDGLVDFARAIDGVEIAAMLEKIPGGVKGSLRGKTPEHRVNEIAEKFGGGGHFAAAGFTVEGVDIPSFYPKFLGLIEERLRAFDTLNGK